VPRPIVLALVVASRFGLLLGLALWLGLGAAALLALPLAGGPPQEGEAAAALLRRIEGVLFGALGLVLLALTARTILDRAAPATSVIGPVAAMAVSRLLLAFAVSPAMRALRLRLADVAAPATAAERGAHGRLEAARALLMTLEVILALYALYAIS
jgi:hypothetical protein